MRKLSGIFLVVFIAALCSQPVLADQDSKNKKDDADLPWERGSISFGGFLAILDTEFSIDSTSLGFGTEINAEDLLSLDEKTLVFRLDAVYRFGESGRHRVYFTWYDLSRSATRQLERQIRVGDRLFPLGTTVNSFFDLSIYKGAYGYSFFQDDRFDVSVSLGIYLADVSVGVSASGIGATAETVTMPLPLIGLRGVFAFTPKLFLKESIEFFYLEIDKFEGSIINNNLALEYNPWKHVGFGIAYETLLLGIKAKGEDYPGVDLEGKLEFLYSGIQLYAKIYF